MFSNRKRQSHRKVAAQN